MTPDTPNDSNEEQPVDEQVAAEQEAAQVDEAAAAEQAQADADPTAEEPTTSERPEEPTAEEAAPPPLGEAEQEMLAVLERELGDAVIEHASAFGNLVVRVRPDAWRRAAEVARDMLACNYLSFIAGMDWQPAPREGGDVGGASSAPVQPTEMSFGAAGSAGRFQVFAHVESTDRKWGVTFKADVDDTQPQVQSWVPVYPGADWHERECWEMYGFAFEGHPSLRHLYLPSEFEGHPLRKDFPLLARRVKPWPGLVDVEAMPGEAEGDAAAETEGAEA